MLSFTLQDVLERYADSLLALLDSVEAAQKKVQKLKTVLFQVLYAVMGQPNHSRKQNQAFLARISAAGFIESYDALVIEQIGKRKAEKDKSADAYLSSWKDFIRWLGSQPDYVSSASSNVSVVVEEPSASFRLIAPSGKSINAKKRELGRSRRPRLIYACKEENLNSYWKAFLVDFEDFCNIVSPEEENRSYRSGRRKQQKKGVRVISFLKSKTDFLRYLGWTIRFAINPLTQKPYKLDELTIKSLYEIEFFKRYIDWQLQERKNTYTAVHHICNLVIKLAQCDLKQETNISREDAHPLIQPLMSLRNQYRPHRGEHPHTSVEALEQRLLEHHECEQIVQYLRLKAKFFQKEWDENRLKKRARMENVWQDYLLIAMLTFGAMRQRELAEMELKGKRLYFDSEDGFYWCCLFPADHKTSGDREYPLFPGPMQKQLTEDLSEYLNTIRPSFEHQFVFFKRGSSRSRFIHRGEPIEGELSEIVQRIMYNASRELFGEEQAKGMCPHDFRRCSATWFAHYGNIEDVMVFAELHGHSPQILMDLYAQVHSKEKTKQAPAVYNQTSAREKAMRYKGTQQDNRVWLKQFADRATAETLIKLRNIIEQSFPI